jgi:quinol-cytochrome oxidoreductase complex cytochrome b subunit
MALVLLGTLLVSGIGLTFFYIPTPEMAPLSLSDLRAGRGIGWFLHNVHRWSALLLFVITSLHGLRGLLSRAYRYPRDVNWWMGLGLLLVVLVMGGTGYLLRWDIKAFALMDLVIGTPTKVPVVGQPLIGVILAGNPLGVLPLHRGYALHVWGLPFLLLILLSLHLTIAWREGLSGSGSRAEGWFRKLPGLGRAGFLPPLLLLLFLVLLAFISPDQEGNDPLARSLFPNPDWLLLVYFLPSWLFEGNSRLLGALILPALILILLGLVPYLGRKSAPPSGPIITAVFGAAVVLWALGQVTWMGVTVPLSGCSACHRPGILGGAPTERQEFRTRDPDWLGDHLREPIDSILDPFGGAHSLKVEDPLE